MKSRNFLHSNPTENQNSPAQGFLMARAPKADVPTSSAVRRFELQHNSSPRFAGRRQERRQGQALLLAVLIMLIAALLSAGFLGVVSGNLNQSARIADKTRAIEASRAGIAYANAQLSGSSQGDLWRPIDVSPAPAPGTTGYDFYYSQLDKVQGWSNGLTPPTVITDPNYQRDLFRFRNVTYGKFPDPTQSLGDSPKFLVRVEELPTDPTNPYYNATYNPGNLYDVEHAGQLKITSIGLSEDDPNVFHRSVAYKVGRAKSPWASALRSVSNWDFKNDLVPQAVIKAVGPGAVAGTTKVTVVNTAVQGLFPPTPFNIVLSHKEPIAGNSKTFGGVVTTVTAGTMAGETDYTITGVAPTGVFPDGITAPIGVNAMQVAAALGTAQTIDLLNTGQPPSVAFPQTFPLQNQPGGILANGSLWLQGQIQLTSLQSVGSKIQSSGAISLLGIKPVPISGEVMGAGDLLSSEADTGTNVFPGTFTTTSGVKTDLVTDAWNKLGAPKPLNLDYAGNRPRTTEPFKPVKLDSAQNLTRYRALTRNSANGIYIDNRLDVEKVGTADMTQAQLVRMLTLNDTSTAEKYLRNGTIDGNGSLEEKHLRGWVGPDEFLARGASVELIQPAGAVPYIRVTNDARSEAVPNGPDGSKVFRDASGASLPGVYSRNLPWPKNGTLFAEGNIRIRGKVNLPAPPTNGTPDLFPSLTVVSLGNIYIEGGVSVDTSTVGTVPNLSPAPNRKKLMLLAKKNVIVNPTRLVLGHVDAQTLSTNTAPITATGTAPNQSVVIPVNDASDFKVGDVIETYDATATLGVRGIVSARDVATIPNTLTASIIESATATVAITSSVKTLLTDTSRVVNTGVTTQFFKADSKNAIERRVLLQNATAQYPNLRLTLDHLGARKPAIKVETEPFGIDGMTGVPYTKPTDLAVKLTNKRVAAGGAFTINTPTIKSDDKRIFAVYNKFTAGTDTFPDATAYPFTNATPAPTAMPSGPVLPTAETEARTFSLTTLEAAFNAVPGRDDGVSKGWKYKATNPVPADVPFFYLAAVGLRPDVSGSTPPVTIADGVDVGQTSFEIPLAASVRLQLNGTDQTLTTLYNSQTTATPTADSYTVPYLGFNPLHGVVIPATPDPNAYEDALTVDQSFYQTDPNILKSILDSRKAVTNFDTNDALVLRQNNDLLAGTPPVALPEYRVRSLKLENSYFGTSAAPLIVPVIRPVDFDIDAYIYAQEGSWLFIPGDYFRTSPQVRTEVDNTGNVIGTYVDTNGDKVAQADEFIFDANGTSKVADLNRNGIVDPGEAEAALRFVRYNYNINFYGAIVENQTAVVADVKDGAGATLASGAVQDWTNKWAAYSNDTNNNGINDDSPAEPDTNARNNPKWKFITYAYDPSLALNSPGANQLRVPVTDDLLYQQ